MDASRGPQVIACIDTSRDPTRVFGSWCRVDDITHTITTSGSGMYGISLGEGAQPSVDRHFHCTEKTGLQGFTPDATWGLKKTNHVRAVGNAFPPHVVGMVSTPLLLVVAGSGILNEPFLIPPRIALRRAPSNLLEQLNTNLKVQEHIEHDDVNHEEVLALIEGDRHLQAEQEEDSERERLLELESLFGSPGSPREVDPYESTESLPSTTCASDPYGGRASFHAEEEDDAVTPVAHDAAQRVALKRESIEGDSQEKKANKKQKTDTRKQQLFMENWMKTEAGPSP